MRYNKTIIKRGESMENMAKNKGYAMIGEKTLCRGVRESFQSYGERKGNKKPQTKKTRGGKKTF